MLRSLDAGCVRDNSTTSFAGNRLQSFGESDVEPRQTPLEPGCTVFEACCAKARIAQSTIAISIAPRSGFPK
jgi:hypothetical protein